MYGAPGQYDSFMVAWNKPEDMEPTLKQLRAALDSCLGPGCYHLSSSLITARKRKALVSNVMLLASGQAVFCVLVASIGITNVMLANVVRRSREYAIRISMGARKQEIFGLVLCESLSIGLLGGLLGILLAGLVSPLVCHLLAQRIHEAAALAPVWCLRGVVISLATCGLSALLAGLFPALLARRLDVLSILRSE
jgi:ABC-type antimicrobial peptide transport system permease subunit